MRSESQHQQPYNTITRTTNSVADGTHSQQRSASFCVNHDQGDGSQKAMKNESETENNRQDASDDILINSARWSLEAPNEQPADATDESSVEALFDGTWRSAVSSVSAWSDAPERKVSSESIDSEISSTSLDASLSLEQDDVFDDLLDSVLYEMDTFEPGLRGVSSSCPRPSALRTSRGTPMHMPISGSYITPSTHLVDEKHRSNGFSQLPNEHMPDNSFNSFQGFNFGLVKGLKNPSRGLITVMRRLCELLSKPRSDHLDSIFVRHLNNALEEMEDAAKPQTKRPRKKAERHTFPKRQRNRPSNSALGDEASLTRLGPTRSLAVRSQPYLTAISKGAETGSETVDLTGLQDGEEESCQQPRDNHTIKGQPFIALEDTVSDFMSSLYY